MGRTRNGVARAKDQEREDDLGVVELELMKLVRHLETFGRKSSLYVRVDRAGYLALRTLDAMGPTCINALAQALHLDASTATRQIGVLESGGFVRRQADPSDGRSSMIVPTAEGRRAMQKVEHGRREAIETVLEGWDESERTDLARVMVKLNVSLFESVAEQNGESHRR